MSRGRQCVGVKLARGRARGWHGMEVEVDRAGAGPSAMVVEKYSVGIFTHKAQG